MSEENMQTTQTKKNLLDPFALLERAFLQGKKQQQRSEQGAQTLPLQQRIYHSIEQTDEVVHQSFIPLRYNKIKGLDHQNNAYLVSTQNCYQKELVKTLMQEESTVFLSKNKKQSSLILQHIKSFCQQAKKKVLFVSPNQHNKIDIQLHLKWYGTKSNLKSSSNFELVFQFTTLANLRKTLFQSMNELNKFNYVLFFNISLQDQIFQETLITLPLELNYLLVLRQQPSNIDSIMTWLAKLRFRPFHLLYQKQKSKYPAVYGITAQSKGIYQLMDAQGKVDDANIDKINKSLQSAQFSGSKPKKQQPIQQHLKGVVRLLYSLDRFPIICLADSKRNVEKYARVLCQTVDLTSKEEKRRIQLYYQTSIEIVQEANNLQSLSIAKEFLIRGIGMFHEGLLPILNQLVILLSKEKLLKVIVTNNLTQSLAFRSIFITQVKAQNKAYLKEIQYLIPPMDETSKAQDKIILLNIQDKIEPDQLKQLFHLKNQPIVSKFQLTLFKYANYQTFQDMDTEYVLARTFKQLQNQQKVEQLRTRERYLQQEINSIVFEDIQPVRAYHQNKLKKKKVQQQIFQKTYTPENVIPYLNVGRVVSLQVDEIDWGLGVIVNFVRVEQVKDEVNYFVDALVYIKMDPVTSKPEPIPLTAQQGKLQVLTFSLRCIKSIKVVTFSSLPNNLKQAENRMIIQRSLKKLRTLETKPVNIQQSRQVIKLKQQLAEVSAQEQKLSYLEPIYSEYLNKVTLQQQLQTVRKQIKLLGEPIEKEKLKCLYKMAKHMDYISKKQLTQTGKAVACFQSPFSMMIVELIKRKFYQKLSGAEIAALTAAIVSDERVNTERLKMANLRLREGLNRMLQQTKQICKLMKKYKLQVSEEQQLQNIKQQYMEGVLRWCQGHQLEQICSTNGYYEGTFIRTLHKIGEMLKQMKEAASLLSQKQTEMRLDQAITLVSRGLANDSIYLLL